MDAKNARLSLQLVDFVEIIENTRQLSSVKIPVSVKLTVDILGVKNRLVGI